MRIWVGGRVSLIIGVAAMLLSITIGTFVGAVAGFYGGTVDTLLMRFNDFMLSIPQLFLLLLVAQLLRTMNLPEISGGPLPIIVIIGALSWMGAARLVRGQFLSFKAKEFVEAAQMSGAKNASHHLAAHFAERGKSDHRLRDSARRQRDHHGIHAQFSRLWHSAADADLGQHAQERAIADDARALGRDFSRLVYFRHRRRDQLSRRWLARRARSAPR